MTMPTDHKLSPEQEPNRILTMPQAEKVSGLSHDTLARRYPDKILHLSKRRKGMRLRHALMLPDDKPAA